MKVLQISTVGIDTDPVLVGIRDFPVHKMALICMDEDKESVNKFGIDLKRTLKISVDIYTIRNKIIEEMILLISEIFDKEHKEFDDIIINVGGGSKHLTCAATVAAFVHGLKAIHVQGNNVTMLPVLRLSYREVLSKAKIEILRAIDLAGGQVESLTELSKLSGYGKPLLSHHISGSKESKSLKSFGLVEVERENRGRVRVRLTTLGKLALLKR